MAKEAFEKIKAAEDEAARIKADAAAKARELTARATADGEKAIEEARQNAAKQYKLRIEAAKARAAEITAQAEKSAAELAEKTIADAKKRLPVCVDKILADIIG